MKHLAGVYKGTGKAELYYQSWHPQASSRATLVIVHGWAEHSGRYANVVRHFIRRSYAIYGFDLRGHGHSPGQRGHINRWSDYREDLRGFLEIVNRREPNQPIFLFGHSLGALIALDYTLHHSEELRGAIISASAIQPAGVAKPGLVAVSRILSRIIPRLSVAIPLDRSALSRDAEWVLISKTDPLMHNRGSVKWGTEVLDAITWIRSHVSELALPVLFLHGEGDRLNLAEGTRLLFDLVTRPDKTLRIYPGMYHELHNDIGHEYVLGDIQTWIGQHA